MKSTLSGALITLCDAIGDAATMEDIYDASIDAVARATGFTRAAVRVFDPDGVLRFKASSGLSDAYRAALEAHIPWGAGAPPPDPIIVVDVRQEPALTAFREACERERVAALAFVPIISRRRVIGSFVLYSDAPYAFDDGEIGATLTIAYQIGFAVERLRSLQEESAFRERLTVLNEASQRLLTSLDADTVMHEILSLARKVIAADAYAVWRREGRVWRCRASRNLSAAFAADELHDTDGTLFDRPIVAEDVMRPSALASRRRAYAKEGIESLISIPIPEPGGSVAGIVFYYRARYRPSEMELQIAAALGRLAAAAVRNARLFGEAQEANRLKDEFLATLSHELRTPLNVILGRTQMLIAARDPAAVRQSGETIERNARLLARLVEDLLDVSRITVGQVKLDLQPLHLGAVIEAAIAGAEPALRAKEIDLKLSVDPALPPVLCDATRLQQIVWNLLSNAIKFTPAHGTVSVRAAAKNGQAELTVSDTGAGIAPEFLPHVFDMFRQAEPATSRRFGGLGLGLSIVRRLVELHGGAVTAMSDGPGKGTTFTVQLPLPAVDASAGSRFAE